MADDLRRVTAAVDQMSIVEPISAVDPSSIVVPISTIASISPPMHDLVFLKLGGALLTDKEGRESIRRDVLARLVAEIAAWPGAVEGRLVLAHGSGSFGHLAARESGFLDQPADPFAFARVAAAARRLAAVVVDALVDAGLPAVGLPGGMLAACEGGRIVACRSDLVRAHLARRHLPVTYGDAAIDTVGDSSIRGGSSIRSDSSIRSGSSIRGDSSIRGGTVPDGAIPGNTVRGGTIASTEPLLAALAADLRPARIVLATDVDGVFAADPHRDASASRFDVITPAERAGVAAALGGARAGTTDVTGGMASKVAAMLDLAERQPGLEVRILSGLRPGAVAAALAGDADAGGTVIRR